MSRRILIAVVAATALWAAPAHAATHELTYRFGPIRVGPYQAVKDGGRVKTPRISGSIVEMDVRVVDAKTGQVIPQNHVMLHHLVFFDSGRHSERHDGTCTRAPERFYGTSEELRSLTMPAGYGYRFDRRDRWTSAWMVMNHTQVDREAYIRYHVVVDDSKSVRPVKPYWVSIVPCGADPQYSVAGNGREGATYTRRRDWKVPVSGRIVAVGGHLHGGARSLRLSQPRCGNRVLVTSKPMYAQPDDPLYQVFPLLHEPDPKEISWWQSGTGVRVRKGETLRVSSDYDGQWPHMRVMGIDHVYIAPDSRAAKAGCAAMPADAQELGPDFVGRPDPPHLELTLAQVQSDGRAHPIDEPPGARVSFQGDGRIKEYAFGYHPAKVSIPVGSKVRWTFEDRSQHDVTLNNGPVGFGGPWSRRGDVYQRRFTVPGTYKLYCSLHPVEMNQVVEVRPNG